MANPGTSGSRDEADYSPKAAIYAIGKAVFGEKKKMDPKLKEVPVWADDNSYNFNYPRRGLAIIFVMEHFDQGLPLRPAAKVDLLNTEKTFKKLGFLVKKYYDLGTEKMLKVLKKAAEDYDHSQSDCFACIISTHGEEKTRTHIPQPNARVMEHYIKTKDGEICTFDIVSLFNSCPTLQEKPKLFFIQACRSRQGGKNVDHGQVVKIYEESIKSTKKPQITNYDDVDISDNAAGHTPEEVAVDSGNFTTGLEYEFTPQDSTRLELLLSQMRSRDEEKKSGGDEGDAKAMKDDDDDDKEVKLEPFVIHPVPCFRDMLIMFPAPSGYFAWSNERYGGWLISALHSTVMNCYPATQDLDLLTLLTQVNNRISIWMETNNPRKQALHKKKSSAVIHHMLTRDVVFSQKT